MSGSEIGTLAFKVLAGGKTKTTAAISAEIRSTRKDPLSESEVFDFLLKAESAGQVKRSRTEEFDESRPVATTSWTLLVDISTISELPKFTSITPPYVENCMVVVSQPTFLKSKGLDLRKLGVPVLNVREAMEKIVLDAKEELRIACPYYDDLFIEVLSADAEKIGKLKSVSVMTENMDPILLKARKLFPNIQVKPFHASTDGATGYKVQGVHAKIMIADQSEVLIGSFNFRFSHVYFNIDMGLFAQGQIAKDYAKIFDSIWGSR